MLAKPVLGITLFQMRLNLVDLLLNDIPFRHPACPPLKPAVNFDCHML